MGWKNLRADIDEDFEGHSGVSERGFVGDLLDVTVGGTQVHPLPKSHRHVPLVSEREVETRAQRAQRRRQERSARVEGLARGQHADCSPNAAYQRRHMDKAYSQGVPRYGAKHSNPNLLGVGPHRRFVPTPEQREKIADLSIRAEDLANLLGVSRAMAFRLRKELLTGKRR